jgi:hypothetical protein
MTQPFPLSSEQRSVLYLDRLLGPGIQHNLNAELPVPDRTPEEIAGALTALSTAHPALRSLITGPDQRQQRLAGPAITLAEAGSGDRHHALRNRRLDRRSEARACAELLPNERLLVAFDHMICDGSARNILSRDLQMLLDQPGAAPAVTRDGSCTLERYCREQELKLVDLRSVECRRWRDALADTQPVTGLSERPESPKTAEWTSVAWTDTWSNGRPLQAATQLAASAFAVAGAALALVLWRRTGVADSAFVTPVSTRRSPMVAGLVSNLVNERPVIYHVDPAQPLGVLVDGLGRSLLRAVRDSWVAWPELIDTVAPFRALFHTPEAEYIQLQVMICDQVPNAAGQQVLGPYQPTADLTCTTLRLYLAPDATAVGAFYGGPVGAQDWVRNLCGTMVSVLSSMRNRMDRQGDLLTAGGDKN